jgi:hypothetical protein
MIEEEKQPMEGDDVSAESSSVESEVTNTEAVEQQSASIAEASTESQVEVVAEAPSGEASALVDELNQKVGYRARIRNHGHSCFLCEIVIRSQFHTTYEPEA